ncbi:MAG: adenosylcobinamide-GDP ribazoletransferase [Acidaminobacteraceae bacterium]
MKRLILLTQFLTRIPINKNLDVDVDDFTKGIIYFPVVGAIIGVFLSILYYAFSYLDLELITISTVLVIAEILITGGLHLDGLSDTFDGIYSNRDRERILEIMKDSRIGANGVISLVSLVVLKIALYISVPSQYIIYVIFLMPIFSRAMVPFICYKAIYPRKEGMGNMFIGKVETKSLVITSFILLLSSLVFIQSIIIIIPMIIFTYLYRAHVTKIIGGITGDVIGASIEIGEIVYLIGSIIVFKFVG